MPNRNVEMQSDASVIQAWMERDDDDDDNNAPHYVARDRSAPGDPPTFWEELAQAMSSEPENGVLLERLRAIPSVARNVLQTHDDDDDVDSDSEETSDGIDSNPSVDSNPRRPNDRIELDPRRVSPFASRLARLARPGSEHRSSSDDINDVD